MVHSLWVSQMGAGVRHTGLVQLDPVGQAAHAFGDFQGCAEAREGVQEHVARCRQLVQEVLHECFREAHIILCLGLGKRS